MRTHVSFGLLGLFCAFLLFGSAQALNRKDIAMAGVAMPQNTSTAVLLEKHNVTGVISQQNASSPTAYDDSVPMVAWYGKKKPDNTSLALSAADVSDCYCSAACTCSGASTFVNCLTHPGGSCIPDDPTVACNSAKTQCSNLDITCTPSSGGCYFQCTPSSPFNGGGGGGGGGGGLSLPIILLIVGGVLLVLGSAGGYFYKRRS